MNIAGWIFLILSILLLVVPIIVCIVKNDWDYWSISLLCIVTMMCFGITNYPDPGMDDFRDKKAIYVEDKHIEISSEGDTLNVYSTYHKEWLPEWKWGRKQKN